MKKSLCFCVLLALAAALLTVSAFADTGPKAQLKVLVKNAPEEPYYLDLLEKGDYQGHTYGSGDGDDTYSGLDWSYSEEEIAALDSELLDALRAAVPEGWHACTAQGTNGAPMWGDLIGSDAGGVRLHSFRYHGVPDTYRIILVTKAAKAGYPESCTGQRCNPAQRWIGRQGSPTRPVRPWPMRCNSCAPSSLPC